VGLTATQRAFAISREPYPAFVGGYGSGKTAAAIARAMALKAHFPQCDLAYYLPTYPLVEDIALRRFPALCEAKGWAYKTRAGNSPQIEFPDAGRIVFRTMENPHRIVGYEVAHSIVDELDTLPIDKARDVWNKIIARNRQQCAMANTVAVATTPEGFRFVYERWVKDPKPGYVVFRARTMDNAQNLPAGYIDNLRNSYSSQLLAAYLDGDFVNLAASAVYAEFDRALNASREAIRPGESLHIGMDFNVGQMAAVVFVLREGDPHALQELTGLLDTPAMIAAIKRRFDGHPVFIYPDASGQARKSANASVSDISLLKEARFTVLANPSNPAVKDRVLSVNRMINNQGARRLRVNIDGCPGLVEGFEKQAYSKTGEPDKTSGLDHVIDAAGYFLSHKFPLVQRSASVSTLII